MPSELGELVRVPLHSSEFCHLIMMVPFRRVYLKIPEPRSKGLILRNSAKKLLSLNGLLFGSALNSCPLYATELKLLHGFSEELNYLNRQLRINHE